MRSPQSHLVRRCSQRAIAFATAGVVAGGIAAATPAAASTSGAATSATTSASVSSTQRATRAVLRSSRSTVVRGQVARLTGKVLYGPDSSRLRFQTVRLQHRVAGGWKTTKWKQLSSRGYAGFTVRPMRTRTYRLYYLGQGSLASSASAAVTVKAKTSTVQARARKVVARAAAQIGKGYRWGAAGPSYFDCSGLTLYSYRAVGVRLPHNANAQKSYGRAVSRAAARPGDLVFFLSGARAYHTGVYAGGGYMYDSARPGTRVAKRKIWDSNVVFRRLL